ncbi:MAG: MbnP family protein [Solimonas sp.]
MALARRIRRTRQPGRMLLACLLSLGLVGLVACGRQGESGAVQIEISHLAGGAPLQLNSGEYATAAGDRFTVTQLRYYLSNFRLHREGGDWFAVAKDEQGSAGYFLVDEAQPASRQFSLEGVPQGRYDGIEFLVGVDDARNHAGAQTGTLDPTRGLFWTWKSGYIFFLFEGRSPQSPDGQLKFHIGGGAPSTARTVYLPLAPKAAQLDAHVQPTIHLHADLAELFRGDSEVRFATLHATMGGPDAATLADNLPGVFRVDHVHNEPPRPKRPS